MDYSNLAWEAHVTVTELMCDGADWAEQCGVEKKEDSISLLYRWCENGLYIKQLPDGKVFLKLLATGEAGVFDGEACMNARGKNGNRFLRRSINVAISLAARQIGWSVTRR